MAKKEIDSFVEALVNIKGIISNLKILSNVIAFDPNSGLIYMVPQSDMHDCFAVITDHNLLEFANKFTYHIINTVEAVAFNKALKKTKTTSEIKDDKSIYFETEGYEEKLTLQSLEDYKDITKQYRKLFKDVDLTKAALAADDPDNNNFEWISISENNLDRIKNNELVVETSVTGDPIYISKSLFGNIKKTNYIQHTVIQQNEDNIVVLFKQVEDGYNIYHLIRYLVEM